jgi:hypothetical protein
MMQAKHRCSMLKIPLQGWPAIDLSALTGRKLAVTKSRCEAVELYAQGYPQEHIFEQTRISRQVLSRLMLRCQSVATDGQIFGYRALILGCNIQGYTRHLKVQRMNGDAAPGCSGALGQLFARFSRLEEFIQSEFLRTRRENKYQNARLSIEELHGKVIDWLEEKGLKENEWPLNTKSEGIETLRRYCKQLIRVHEKRYLAARCGPLAVGNSNIGTGNAPVFKTRRPFGAVQLDFHKVDSASIIRVTNPFGVEIVVPLPRWHIGLLIDEHYELILGAIVALEITPSSDSVLETIETGLMPVLAKSGSVAIAIGAGRKVFANQLLAGLAGQGFDVIRMDNGWSNIAIHVIDNIIDIIGAAVDFGPVRSWWTRHNIERVFGLMTRAALQSSPATYGANVLDTRRENPEQTAVQLDIRLTDLICALEKVTADHNEQRTAGLLMAQPIDALAAVMDNPASPFIYAPIPNISRRDEGGRGVMMYKAFTVVIRGSLAKGERPYIKIGGWRYTSKTIAQDFSQIGNKLKVYCSLRDARIVYATNLTTSEDIGRLYPPAKWDETFVSFRMRALFQSNGQTMRRKEKRKSKTHEWLPDDDVPDQPSRTDAMRLAQQALEKSRVKPTSEEPPATAPDATMPAAAPLLDESDSGLFNLNSLPNT